MSRDDIILQDVVVQDVSAAEGNNDDDESPNASPVAPSDDESPNASPVAPSTGFSTDFYNDSLPVINPWSRHLASWWPVYIIFLLLVAASWVAFFLLNNRDGSTHAQSNPTVSTVDSENDIFLQLRDLFREYSDDPYAFMVPDSPQSRALSWFATVQQDPTLQLGNQDDDPTLMSRLIQRYALVVLAYSCGGDKWIGVISWMSRPMAHECDWLRVECEDDQVTKIILDNTGMIGSIPEEIGLLTQLSFLTAGGNRLEGGLLPLSVYGKLTNLQVIHFNLNAMSFSIPTEIGLLSNSLLKFDCSTNFLTGSLPQELKALSKLELVDLSFNDVEGQIFDFSPYWPNLEALYVGFTKLNGSFPADPHQSTRNLTVLDVRALAQLTSIPTTIGLMTTLKHLQFASLLYESTTMTGTLPTELGLLANLEFLFMEDTEVNGTIPSEFGQMSKLQILNLGKNDLSSSIPSEISHMINLHYLNLARNQLSGTVPSELGLMPNLERLYVFDNSKGLVIPDDLCQPFLSITCSCDDICNCCSGSEFC